MKTYPMRMAERKLSESEAHKILDAGEYCVISTVDEDGTPYCVPLSYVREGSTLYFHTTAGTGHKMDDFAHDERVCVAVATEVEPCFEETFFTSRFASVIARGRISLVQDRVTVRKVLVALCMKYLPEFKHEIGGGIEREIDDTAVWMVELDEIAAKGGRRREK